MHWSISLQSLAHSSVVSRLYPLIICPLANEPLWLNSYPLSPPELQQSTRHCKIFLVNIFRNIDINIRIDIYIMHRILTIFKAWSSAKRPQKQQSCSIHDRTLEKKREWIWYVLQKVVEKYMIFQFGCPYGWIFWFEMNIMYEWNNIYSTSTVNWDKKYFCNASVPSKQTVWLVF